MNLTIVESPSGLNHLAWTSQLTGHTPVIHDTVCGRQVNMETWVRVRTFDGWLDGKSKRTISLAVRNTTAMVCERCFPTR
jgi:hypothetical protein